MKPVLISRRRALQWLSALGVSMGLQGVAVGRSCHALVDDLDLNAVREIGREYLAAYPQDAEVKSAASLLGVDAPAAEQLEELHSRMHDDFAADRIIHLSGWFVSATEARIFAALSSCMS